MKIKAFLKEKSYAIALQLFISSLTFLFLYAIQCPLSLILFLQILAWIPIFISLSIDFYRRKQFYDNVTLTLKSLDQKHLISELIEEPNFIDGKAFYQILHEIDRSSADTIHFYKNLQNEYKSYIEMWIHEVKTPLAAARLILDNNPSTISESVSEELSNIEGFIEQALFYARSTNPEKDYLIKEMSLQECIHKVIRKHAKPFIYKQIKVETHHIEQRVYSDPKWLEFILDQIVANALKYTPSQTGVITFTCDVFEHNIQLHIKDNGIGIASNELKRVFDKGFTGNNGRSNEHATGIGLYLCKTLCKKLYLDISLTSTLHKGTIVTLTFPLNSKMILQ